MIAIIGKGGSGKSGSGESGSGESTLLRCINSLEWFQEGALRVTAARCVTATRALAMEPSVTTMLGVLGALVSRVPLQP